MKDAKQKVWNYFSNAKGSPFEDVSLMDMATGYPESLALKFSPEGEAHSRYYMETIPQIIRQQDPSLTKKTDRGLFDVIANYMGGYDAAQQFQGKTDDLERLAKLYQFTDYAKRPTDSANDYIENMAGVNAYTPGSERLNDQALYEQARKYADERINSGAMQDYSDANTPFSAYVLGTIKEAIRRMN